MRDCLGAGAGEIRQGLSDRHQADGNGWTLPWFSLILLLEI